MSEREPHRVFCEEAIPHLERLLEIARAIAADDGSVVFKPSDCKALVVADDFLTAMQIAVVAKAAAETAREASNN